MMFGYGEVRAAIEPGNVPVQDRDISLPALEQELRLGVGRDGQSAFVLVGPGQPTATTLEGRQFRFDPWIDLVDHSTGIMLHDVCVLRFRPVDDTDVRDAVAAVFEGLIQLTRSTPEALGAAIQTMESLFESGLKSRVPRETEIGLAGELLVIAEAADPAALVKTWHSRAEGRFDFSAQGERLEVKTTTASDRVHWFSSEQLVPIPGVCTTFVSILLPLVETGSTVASTFAGMTGLTPNERTRVRNIIIDVAKEPPEILTSVVFDRAAAKASLLHHSAQEVPTPVAVPGVRRMRWEAVVAGSAASTATCGFATVLGFVS